MSVTEDGVLVINPLFVIQSHSETNAKGDGKDDKEDDKGAPPLELATTAGVLVGDLDLFITLLNVLDRVDGIVFGNLNDGFLLLNNCCKFLVENGELGECLLDALQLAVTSAYIS